MNDQQFNWDEEMEERVFGARPVDDYNFKKRTFPPYSSDPVRARELVARVNASGKYQMKVSSPGQDVAEEFTVEVQPAKGGERLAYCRAREEARAICEAIVTANVQLRD